MSVERFDQLVAWIRETVYSTPEMYADVTASSLWEIGPPHQTACRLASEAGCLVAEYSWDTFRFFPDPEAQQQKYLPSRK